MRTKQVEYKSEGRMRRGVSHMAGSGWRVAATTQLERRRGCLARLLWLPFWARKRSHYLVTFERA